MAEITENLAAASGREREPRERGATGEATVLDLSCSQHHLSSSEVGQARDQTWRTQ